MILQVFLILSEHLIEFMGLGLLAALMMRYLAFKSGKRDQNYFMTFARGMEKELQAEDRLQKIKDVEGWMTNLLDKVVGLLPERTLRNQPRSPEGGSFRFQE